MPLAAISPSCHPPAACAPCSAPPRSPSPRCSPRRRSRPPPRPPPRPAHRAPCPASTWPARTASAPRATTRRRCGSPSPDGVLSDVYEPTDRQHERPVAAVRRHRRLDVHRPAAARHDLHRQGRLDRHGLHRHRPQRAARLPAGDHLRRRPGPRHDPHAHHARPGRRSCCACYARLDAHVNGNGGGGGTRRTAAPTPAPSTRPASRSSATRTTVSQAANRDYAVPTFMALDSASLRTASVGYAGTSVRRPRSSSTPRTP